MLKRITSNLVFLIVSITAISHATANTEQSDLKKALMEISHPKGLVEVCAENPVLKNTLGVFAMGNEDDVTHCFITKEQYENISTIGERGVDSLLIIKEKTDLIDNFKDSYNRKKENDNGKRFDDFLEDPAITSFDAENKATINYDLIEINPILQLDEGIDSFIYRNQGYLYEEGKRIDYDLIQVFTCLIIENQYVYSLYQFDHKTNEETVKELLAIKEYYNRILGEIKANMSDKKNTANEDSFS